MWHGLMPPTMMLPLYALTALIWAGAGSQAAAQCLPTIAVYAVLQRCGIQATPAPSPFFHVPVANPYPTCPKSKHKGDRVARGRPRGATRNEASGKSAPRGRSMARQTSRSQGHNDVSIPRTQTLVRRKSRTRSHRQATPNNLRYLCRHRKCGRQQ